MKLKKIYLALLFTASCLVAQENDGTLNKTTINNEGTFKIGRGLTIEPNEMSINKSFVVKNIAIGLDEREKVVAVLRSLLADNYVLYTKALNFHWNVEGELFSQLHDFFKKLYEDLQQTNDLFAERIRALGGYAPGSLQQFLVLTQLKENNGGQLAYRSMLQILLDDFEMVIRSLRSAAQLTADNNDWGSNNMLAGLIEKQEKNAWMIRAHLQK